MSAGRTLDRGTTPAPAGPRRPADEDGVVRVAHVVVGLEPGGLENFVTEMVHYFAGTSVVMSVVNVSGRAGRLAPEIRPYVEDFRVLDPVPRFSMLAPVGLTRCLRQLAPDVVHLHSGTWYKGAFASRLARIPRVIYTEHGLDPEDPGLGRYVRKRAADWTDVIVAVSDRLQAHLCSEFPHHAPRVCTIANGVDMTAFAPGPRSPELLRRLDLPAGATIVGTMGRLEKIKAQDLLIRAFAALLDRVKTGPARDRLDPYLLICGEGSRRRALETLVHNLGLQDRVRLPGWVQTPADYYRLFDVFVLSSVSEGAPLSLLEAMACGVAPVVTAVGANRELLGPRLSRQVVPPRDVEALARTLLETLASRDRCRQVQVEARRRIGRHYDSRQTMEHYHRLYRSGVLETREASPQA